MYNRLKTAAGIFLTAVSILLCAVSVIGSFTDTQYVPVPSGKNMSGPIYPVETETGGTVLVNISEAGELVSLPGIGETLSGLIVAERDQNGPYYYAEDLEEVKGIGPGTLRKFRNMLDLTQGESEEENGISGSVP